MQAASGIDDAPRRQERAGAVLAPRIVPHTRPLCFHGGRLYCTRFDRICSTADYGRTFQDEGSLELPWTQRILRLSTHAQRAARAAVYRMRVLSDGRRIFVFRGGIYRQRPGEARAVCTHRIDRGTRPVSLAVGADGLIVFGDYWRNPELEAIRIWGSRDGGESWQVVSTFAPGEVRHVHGVSYDRWEDCFWICTGDDDRQCRLLRASADFSEMRMVRSGGQGNRFYYLLVTERELITATDTPFEQNYVCAIAKRDGELRRLAAIENTSFYSCEVDGTFYVSTNAEPSEVNDCDACHLWAGGRDSASWRHVLEFPVDGLTKLARLPGVPEGLFQYPQLFFPEGDNPDAVLVCHATGLGGHDGAMLCYEPPP